MEAGKTRVRSSQTTMGYALCQKVASGNARLWQVPSVGDGAPTSHLEISLWELTGVNSKGTRLKAGNQGSRRCSGTDKQRGGPKTRERNKEQKRSTSDGAVKSARPGWDAAGPPGRLQAPSTDGRHAPSCAGRSTDGERERVRTGLWTPRRAGPESVGDMSVKLMERSGLQIQISAPATGRQDGAHPLRESVSTKRSSVSTAPWDTGTGDEDELVMRDKKG